MMIRISNIFFFTLLILQLFSVEKGFANVNSDTLHYEDFIYVVAKNHPLVKKAKLITREAELNKRIARGGFDPVFYGNSFTKNYDDKRYYDLINTSLKIPTWFGLSGNIDYEKNAGYYVNEQNNTPDNGLLSSGISLTVGKGLFIDERRFHLKNAKILEEKSEFDQFQELNKLILNAAASYWNWVALQNIYEVQKNYLSITEERFLNTKKSFKQGFKAAIDTTEVLAQLDFRRYETEKTKQKLNKARLKLSVFLWDEDLIPLELALETNAPKLTSINVDDAIVADSIDVDNHPIIQSYQKKLESTELYKRYKFEGLKPEVNVKYNLLNTPLGGLRTSPFYFNDYKLGIQVKVPVLMRKSIGDFQQSKLKVQKVNFELMYKKLSLENKIKTVQFNVESIEKQLKSLGSTTENYKKVLNAEKRKFAIGESSVFLVNYRENKYLEYQMKLFKLHSQYNIELKQLDFQLGKALF